MRKKLAVVLLVLSTAAITVAQSSDFPATAAGKLATSFIQMLASTGDEPLKVFIANAMAANPDLTLDQRVQRFRGIRFDLGGGKLVKVLKIDDAGAQLILETARGETLMVSLGFTPDAEKRIAGLRVEPVDKNSAATPETADQKQFPEAELLPAVEKYLDALVKADKFSGVVLIAKNGRPIFNKAYGFADREKRIANLVNTKFNIGSENKIFTQLAIGMLADEGKLSLSDKLGKHLPDYPNKDAAGKITIEQLLDMSSGIGDFFGSEFEAADKNKIRTNKDYFQFFASKPPLFEPGTKKRYSNGGYAVLGAIIEKVSGKSYYDFVRERIYRPAGMFNTEHYEKDKSIPNRAEGYTKNDAGELVNNYAMRPARGSAAGGGYSTAEDMLKFANALESGKLAAPKSLKEARDPMVRMLGGGIGIAGGSPGVNAAFETRVKGSYTIVVMSNLDPPSAEDVARQIRTWIGR